MKHRLIDADGPSTYIVILETGDEVAASLNRFAEDNKLAGSSFKGLEPSPAPRSGGSTGKQKNTKQRRSFRNSLRFYRSSGMSRSRTANRSCMRI
jgi:hypothetical protein